MAKMDKEKIKKKLSSSLFRVRSARGQKENKRAAVKQLSEALQSPSLSMVPLSRVGVTFSFWQLLKLKFLLWIGQKRLAQKMILKALKLWSK